ncbi:MAG: ABC transporter ATP-binding protein [Gemmataceae bacterium]
MPGQTLTVDTLSFTHPGGRPALSEVSLSVPPGERLVVLGPSGSGKTTLLRVLAGLATPQTGSICWGETNWARLAPAQRPIAFITQRAALYPQLRLREQLSPEAAWDLLQLRPLAERYPHELSGGEQQRAALARFTERPAGLWLLDEPFAALDPAFRSEFRDILHLLLKASAATMILVSHDPNDALALGHRVGVMDCGRLVQLGTPDELATHPHNRFVAVALGQYYYLPTASLPEGRWSATIAPTFGYRSRDTRILPFGTYPPEGWPLFEGGILESCHSTGIAPEGTLASGGLRWRFQGYDALPPVGSPVRWTTDPAKLVWFDSAGRTLPRTVSTQPH